MDDKEDIVLSRLMKETDYEDVIDINVFLKKLRADGSCCYKAI